MLRRCLGSKKLEYTLNTNQGTPDVYVNGVYKGTVSNEFVSGKIPNIKLM